MKPERLIASRLRFGSGVAAVSIAVSFLVMIVANAISAGFRSTLRDGVAAVVGDIRISTPTMSSTGGENPIPAHLPSEKDILAIDGVDSVSPVVVRSAVVRSGGIIQGVIIKGVESVEDGSLGVEIPSRLSEITGLGEGDDLVTWFVGDKLKVRKFHIRKVYDSLVEDGSTMLIRASIGDIRRVNGWSEDLASSVEVALKPAYRSEAMTQAICERIGTLLVLSPDESENGLLVTTSRADYSELFSWLDLLRNNVSVILILMTIVAGFNMISGLLILLFRNIPTIGILKTLGMTDKAISSAFLRASAVLILKGMAVGNAIAILFCILQSRFQLIRLNPENYYVSAVPVKFDLLPVLAIDIVSFAVIMLLLLIPSLFISRVDPAETVKMD